jgi:predicted nucleic acid-binding protein
MEKSGEDFMRSLPTVDSLLVATAKVHGLTLVMRNVADVSGLHQPIRINSVV